MVRNYSLKINLLKSFIKMQFKNNKNKETKKAHCKVCFDAGKPESEYSSHWVKNFQGQVTCPTLLNLECRYCFKRGHTVKFCNALAKNKAKMNEKDKQPLVVKLPVVPISQKKPINQFEVLMDSDNEEDEQAEKVEQEFPTLCKQPLNANRNAICNTMNWAAIAAKEPQQPPVKYIEFPPVNPDKETDTKSAGKLAPWTKQPTQPTKRWADWSDDDSDSEDDNLQPDYYEQTWAETDDDSYHQICEEDNYNDYNQTVNLYYNRDEINYQTEW